MKRILLAIARLFAGAAADPDVLQLHLIDDEANEFQCAQKTFEPPRNGPGDKLAWISEMVRKSEIVRPRHEVYRPGDRGFIKMRGAMRSEDWGPTFLVRG